MKLMEKWTNNLFNNLEKDVNKTILINILENNGRQCLPTNFKRKAKSIRKKSKDENIFIKKLAKIWKHLKIVNDEIYVVYPKCYCYVVGKFSGTVPYSYCNCSRGWILELFEYSLGRSVKVDTLKTIKRGDNECRFRVKM